MQYARGVLMVVSVLRAGNKRTEATSRDDVGPI